MITFKDLFSGYSVDDLDVARIFYGEILGIDIEMNEMGMLNLILPSTQRVLIYPKDDHEPASFTVLNLIVADVETAVTELNDQGVVTKIYSDDSGMVTDERGIARGQGPTIAWFRDPAGNVLSVIEV